MQILLTEIIVLVEKRYSRIGLCVQNVFGEYPHLGRVVRQSGHRPRKMRRIVPARNTTLQQQLRDLAVVQILLDGDIWRGSHRSIVEEDAVGFDQLACAFDGFGRIEGIVHADQLDLTTIDAALVVDHREIRERCFAECAVSGNRPAVRSSLTQRDFLVGDAAIVFLLGGGRRRREHNDRHHRDAGRYTSAHGSPPRFSLFVADGQRRTVARRRSLAAPDPRAIRRGYNCPLQRRLAARPDRS